MAFEVEAAKVFEEDLTLFEKDYYSMVIGWEMLTEFTVSKILTFSLAQSLDQFVLANRHSYSSRESHRSIIEREEQLIVSF